MYYATTPGTSSSSQPTWPQVVGNTVNDGSVVWTNVGTPPSVWFIRATQRNGAGFAGKGKSFGESLPSAESQLICSPTLAPITGPPNIVGFFYNTVGQGGSNGSTGTQQGGGWAIYAGHSSGTETLAQYVTPTSNGIAPVSSIAVGFTLANMPPPDWTANTVESRLNLIKPTTGNAGGFIYIAAGTAGVTGTSAPTWDQTIGNTVTDGGVSWVNIGAGAVPQYDTSGQMLVQGAWQGSAPVVITPTNDVIHFDMDYGLTETTTVTTTGSTVTIDNPTCNEGTCQASDIGRFIDVKVACNNASDCGTLAFGAHVKHDSTFVMPTNGTSITCRLRMVSTTEFDQWGACSNVM